MTVSKEEQKKIRPEMRGIIVWGRVEQERWRAEYEQTARYEL